MQELPRPYISYSAYHLWRTNREQYRRRYYDNEKPFETIETKFGKQIADWLESDDPRTKHIPNYLAREYDIEVMIDGTRVIGRIDGFDEARIRFLDHKSGHASKDGKVPWDLMKVRKLEQLPFYSMLLKEKFGKVDNICHLVWIETDWKKNTTEFDGHVLEAGSRELQMTGRVKKFRRIIREFERKRIKKDLINAINEIKKDYADYRSRQEKTIQLDGQTKPEEKAVEVRQG